MLREVVFETDFDKIFINALYHMTIILVKSIQLLSEMDGKKTYFEQIFVFVIYFDTKYTRLYPTDGSKSEIKTHVLSVRVLNYYNWRKNLRTTNFKILYVHFTKSLIRFTHYQQQIYKNKKLTDIRFFRSTNSISIQ